MRSERWMTPGTYSRPAEPMPFISPNLAPLALTHSGPLGPSTTWGMRSLNWAEAFLTKRSGGNQIRSTWPSAEMTSYFILPPSLPPKGEVPGEAGGWGRGQVGALADLHSTSSTDGESSSDLRVAFAPIPSLREVLIPSGEELVRRLPIAEMLQ